MEGDGPNLVRKKGEWRSAFPPPDKKKSERKPQSEEEIGILQYLQKGPGSALSFERREGGKGATGKGGMGRRCLL